MYRLVLYYLIALLLGAVILSIFGILPYPAVDILLITSLLVGVCVGTNFVLAKIMGIITNGESAYITALILALIITPAHTTLNLLFVVEAGLLAMGSKYLLTYRNNHIFNPVAIAVVITYLIANQSPSWWVGTVSLLPIVIIGGLLVVRKVHRADMVLTFIGVTLLTTIIAGTLKSSNVSFLVQQTLKESPLFFFAFVMFTEPFTMPVHRTQQLVYSALVGFLFSPQVHLGGLYFTPELALCIGNALAFIGNPKLKLILTLKEKNQIADGTFDFIFTPSQPVSYQPGQYMEWTLPVPSSDERGNRRYFTLASSPTEDTVRMGIKFYPSPSRFKQVMMDMKPGDTILASQLSGQFLLPKDTTQKCVYIAGGIGITPFRSHIKYLIDNGQKRDIVLMYANNRVEDIAYQDIFTDAQAKLGIKTVYALGDVPAIPPTWTGEKGYINQEIITRTVPDFKERTFYISGPHVMVTTFEKLLKQMGVQGWNIHTDYFPGFV